MNIITDLILRISDLAEAEGRLIRDQVIRSATALLLLAAAACVLFVGIVGMGVALTLALMTVMHPAWAIAITSGVLLMIGAGVWLAAHSHANGPRRFS